MLLIAVSFLTHTSYYVDQSYTGFTEGENAKRQVSERIATTHKVYKMAPKESDERGYSLCPRLSS